MDEKTTQRIHAAITQCERMTHVAYFGFLYIGEHSLYRAAAGILCIMSSFGIARVGVQCLAKCYHKAKQRKNNAKKESTDAD